MIFSDEKPIERVMNNAFTKMRTLIDADTVVGTPITTADGYSIIPISKVTMGFITGGGEYSDMSREHYTEYPFAGGSGTGLAITPIGFLVNDGRAIKFISIGDESLIEKILSKIPDTLESIFSGVSDIKNK